jgi:hypothetical protein
VTENYLTYSGNNLLNVRLPDGSRVLYPPRARHGMPPAAVSGAVAEAFAHPVDMPPLTEL